MAGGFGIGSPVPNPGAADRTRSSRACSGCAPPESVRSSLMPPTHIGRYSIVGILGEGGMGTVYEAVQDQPRRTVALKIIRPDYVTPELRRRFERESEVLGRLQHPGIAQVYEAGTEEGPDGAQSYFAMELVRGASLVDMPTPTISHSRNVSICSPASVTLFTMHTSRAWFTGT